MTKHFDRKSQEKRSRNQMADSYNPESCENNTMCLHTLVIIIAAILITIITNTNLTTLIYTDTNESLIVNLKNSLSYDFNLFFVVLAYYWMLSRSIRCIKCGRRVSIVYISLALIFAFFMVEGQRYSGQVDIQSFSINITTILIYVIVMISWAILFLAALILLDDLMEHISSTPRIDNSAEICKHISKHIFKYAFFLMLIILIPVSLIAYPGQFMGDTPGIIAQGFNIETYHPYWSPTDGGIKLGNHHPIAYTMLIHYCLLIGKSTIGSYSFGIYLVVLLQVLITALAFSYSVSLLHRSNSIHLGTAFVLICCYAFNAQVQTNVILISKDALYGASLILFLASAYGLCNDIKSNMIYTLFILGAFCSILFRNDGIYVIVTTLIALVSQRGSRRISAVLLPVIVVFWLTFNRLLLPIANVAPGSKREVLSIPFQQTARYLLLHPDDVTESETKAIDKVLIYDEVASSYDPDISDPVKTLYREDATSSDIRNYFVAWKSMFFRHPATYIYAFLNNKYKYFDPNQAPEIAFSFEWSEAIMEVANEYCKELNTDFRYPLHVKSLQHNYETIRDTFFRLPIIGAFNAAPIYLWISLVMLAYNVKHKNMRALVALTPIFMIFLINFAGPTNGNYFRYVYPVMLYLPIALGTTLITEDMSEL